TAMTPDVFGNSPLAFALRSTSGYAVGVPGEVACAATALDHWGTITLAEALQPAIDAASCGIRVSSRLAKDSDADRLKNETANASPVKDAYDVARHVFRPNDAPLHKGDLLVQADLAATLEQIAEGGPDAFYHCGHASGIADAILETQLVTRPDNPNGVGTM